MVMTRRASLLERQRSESVALSDQSEPKVEIEAEVEVEDVRDQSIDARSSPSLLRPTPQPQAVVIVDVEDNDDDVVEAFSAIKPVDDDDKSYLALTAIVEAPLTASSSAFSLNLASPIPVVKTEVIVLDSEDEEEARDTLGVMRVVRALPVRARGRLSSAGSVVSIEDAKTSIDDFMTDREAFTADEDNKLRFWQSLCIEFRLVKVEGDPIPSFDQLTLNDGTSQPWSDTQNLPPVPTSCKEAYKILKAKAHVNLVDYFAARELPLAPGEERDYSHLLFPDRLAVVKYSRKTKKYASRADAKQEWLQPLMKIMRNNAKQ